LRGEELDCKHLSSNLCQLEVFEANQYQKITQNRNLLDFQSFVVSLNQSPENDAKEQPAVCGNAYTDLTLKTNAENLRLIRK